MKKFSMIFILVAIIILPGCIKIRSTSNNTESQSTGGVYVSTDYGKTWKSSDLIATVGDEKPSLRGYSMYTFAMDPQDHNALYVGTQANGVFVSYDKAASWMQFPSFASGAVSSLIVHPSDKCTLYASVANQMVMTTDCARTWERVYFDTRTETRIVSIVIDWVEPNVVYIGTSRGDVLKSSDGGVSWKTILRTDNKIIKLLIGQDTRNLFVGTVYNGIYISNDKGSSWTKHFEDIEKAGSAEELTDMVLDYGNNVLLISTGHGLIKTDDMGKTWSAIPLLTAPGEATIYSIAVNQTNWKQLYYATGSTLYKSDDGGATWEAVKMPTRSLPRFLQVHPSEPNRLLIGYQIIQE